MSRKTTPIVKAVLSALHWSGLGTLLAPSTRGRGIIFTLHSVAPGAPLDFEPNRILRITPEFLDLALTRVKAQGYDILSLDDMAARLARPATPGERPFAVFTFDDGYRDNRDHAYPVLKAHNAPFAIYIPSEYPEGRGELWWLVLEESIRKANHVEIQVRDRHLSLPARTTAEKQHAFHEIYWAIRPLPERELRSYVRTLAESVGFDAAGLCARLIMTWDEIRDLAKDPLVTIGAHTRHHLAIAKLPEDEARAEIGESVARIEAELGRPCRHFSFPYGDAGSAGPRDFRIAEELGLTTAVTTHKAVLTHRYAAGLTSLPRVSLNGEYQSSAFLSVMMTGLPFALSDFARNARTRLLGKTEGSAAVQPFTAPRLDPGAASTQ